MTEQDYTHILRSLPSVEELLRHTELSKIHDVFPHEIVVTTVRMVISEARERVFSGELLAIDADELAKRAAAHLNAFKAPSLRRVVNATGVIIHTNLGRSCLADAAIDAVQDVIKGYSTLEYDTQRMSRGSRHNHYEQLLCALTGAEAAMAVNNNAAAVMLVLQTLAQGKEVVVSRGELVEIGGSFRVPDIMALSGASMKEVGTTNKTHLFDYENAITESTAMLLKVHPSNYRLLGFTESVAVHDLAFLAKKENNARKAKAHEANVPFEKVVVYEDQGSATFVDLPGICDSESLSVTQRLNQGADIVSFSADKVLGGPQAGIIVGSKTYIDKLKKHPLARALRLDKMTIAALEATLKLYINEREALLHIPTLRMLTASVETLESDAKKLASRIKKHITSSIAHVRVDDDISRAGGGAFPMCDIPTKVVRVTLKKGNVFDCVAFMQQEFLVPVVARVAQDEIIFDLRTLQNEEEMQLVSAAFGAYIESISS